VRGIGGGCRLREVIGAERLEAVGSGGAPVILAFWHNRTVYLAHWLERRFLSRGVPLAALASRSRDGELAAKLGRMLHAVVIRGSASRGGSEGLRRLYRAVRGGTSCAMAVDGPRGPLYEAKPGTVVLAQMTGAPVVPVAWAADRVWALRSWDRLLIPKPFARVVMAVGEPLEVPRQLDAEQLAAEQRRLEHALRSLTEEVERQAGAAGD
jgi:lysophospholipid acyltransferase (LPLAT)-like uncharacterized protein